jgi:hypothetical protein
LKRRKDKLRYLLLCAFVSLIATIIVWLLIGDPKSDDLRDEDPVRLVTATINEEDGIQYITTDGAQSISVFVNIPAKWLIHIGNKEDEGVFSIPTFQFECELLVGDNIIEFTPKLAGAYEFTSKSGDGSIVVLGDSS